MTKEERLQLPAITVQEWAQLNEKPRSTALKWANDGDIVAWRSGGVWLVKPNEPIPLPKPQGAAAHQVRKRRE